MKDSKKLSNRAGRWRRSAFILLSLSLLSVNMTVGSAEDAPLSALADSLRLKDLVATAMDRNPQVLVAQSAWDAARNVPAQRGALADPVLSFGHFVESVETRVGPQENRLSLQQKIPWPGKLGDGRSAARQAADAVEMDLHSTRHVVRMEVSQNYYELRWLEVALGFLQEELDILSHIEEAAQVKYATGTAGQQDILKVQVEQANIQRRILEMDQMAASLRSRLLGMLDLDPTTPLGPTRDGPPRLHPKTLEDLLRLGQEMRPEIAASGHRIRSAEESVAHARKSYLPDLTLKLDYIQIGQPATSGLEDAGKDAIAIGASINLPIWIGKNGARVREAEALAAASRSRLRGAVARTRAEIQDALLSVRASLETVRLYETSILPQAEQAFFATQAAYQTGEADFLTYLDSERAFLDLRIAHARVLSDLGSRYALLERAVGVPLEEILQQEGQQEGMKP